MRWPRFLRRRARYAPPRPRTFTEQLLDDAKRMVPIDTGRLRAELLDGSAFTDATAVAQQSLHVIVDYGTGEIRSAPAEDDAASGKLEP